PADDQQVLEALGGDQGSACALTFQQRIRGDRRTVDHLVSLSCAPYSFEDHRCGRLRTRTNLERRDPAVILQNHEVRKRAACIDPDPHRRISTKVATTAVASMPFSSCPARSRVMMRVLAGISAVAASNSSMPAKGSRVPWTNSAGVRQSAKCAVRSCCGFLGGCSG